MKLIYFTNNFPSGKTIQWKIQELENFAKEVDEIIVVPFQHSITSTQQIKLPQNIRLCAGLFTSAKTPKLRMRFLQLINSEHRRIFVSEFFSNNVYRRKNLFINWIVESYYLLLLINHPTIKALAASNNSETLWYFFWGRNAALIIPYLKKKVNAKIAVRFHGYDLYKFRNDGYLPYQKEIVLNADILLPCSLDGGKYLQEEFGVNFEKILISRLGCRSSGVVDKKFNKSELSIVSCSFCLPVKRLSLIIAALKNISIPISWTHIGDGPLFDELKESAQVLESSNCKIKFTGYLPGSSIIDNYLSGNYDAFVNVSESEGVPVSIMEALSVGLPIIATDVGGTSELVDNSVGLLLNKDITAKELADSLSTFFFLDNKDKDFMRSAARKRYEEFCNVDRNSLKLIKDLKRFFKL